MTRNRIPKRGIPILLATILVACTGSGATDGTGTTLASRDTTIPTAAETTSTSQGPETTSSPDTTASPETTAPAETTTSGPASTTGPGDPQLLYDEVPVTAEQEACAGADGAVVFRSEEDSTIVGFENGIFLRYIARDGTVTETADVTVTGNDAETSYAGDLRIRDGTVSVKIVLPTEMTDLAECE